MSSPLSAPWISRSVILRSASFLTAKSGGPAVGPERGYVGLGSRIRRHEPKLPLLDLNHHRRGGGILPCLIEAETTAGDEHRLVIGVRDVGRGDRVADLLRIELPRPLER